MNVLIACECSGRVRDAFIRHGHNAWSCDILPGEGHNVHRHIQDDIGKVLGWYGDSGYTLPNGMTVWANHWDMLIAHPPCTYLCNSGVRWLFNQGGSHNETRWQQMREGAELFRKLLDTPIPRKAIENSIPHKYALELIGRKYDQVVQPWMFGSPYTKAACWWLEGLPPLVPTHTKPDAPAAKCHRMAPGANRAKLRSETEPEVAEAMAEQWGKP